VFRKVLIANRGEIAVRVIRACREMGVKAVAVYSEADREAPHVWLADEAYPIGPAPAAESYLRGDRLIEVALRAGCEAVHPGYGFLAERPAFAYAVEQAGLVFIGPTSDAMAALGDKTEARRTMKAAGVPLVPGLDWPAADAAALARAADELGYPVLLKAAAGGGGKGMRVVRSPDELAAAFRGAGHEAESAFGDRRIYLEKYLDGPRHVEIQILADAHGNVVHLGERECSIQRRHQKLLEESPSPALDPAMREAMGAAAVAAARAVGYRNAGTVEFLVHDGRFYFLEVNARIQVEHPVTEMVTGLDLVQAQLRIAAGERLWFRQEDVRWTGHALECRISGEDPWNRFYPSAGRIERWHVPGGPGVRWDGGVVAGNEVTLHYDPLLAKCIVHAPDRPSAIARMERALREFWVEGIATTQPFHLAVLREPDFRAGAYDTRYLETHPDLLDRFVAEDPEAARAAAVAAALLEERARRAVDAGDGRAAKAGDAASAWRRALGGGYAPGTWTGR
jgi:acetyl-CoA carboxylase biotin carboxylase subunit